MERWRAVRGWPYEVSDLGRVRRADGRPLSLERTRAGYLRAQMQSGGKHRRALVHHLVAAAFLPPPPGPIGRERGCYQINHIDAAKSNNRPQNLEWTTPAENHRHATRMGLKCRGIRHHNAKLTPATVREARGRAAAGERHADIAADFGVSRPAISYAVRGETWRHVKEN